MTRPTNPFSLYGSMATGSRFLGRDHEVEQLRDRLLTDPSGFASVAVVGLPRIGKSSLVKRAILDAPRDLLVERKAVVVTITVSTVGAGKADQLLLHVLDEIVREVSEPATDGIPGFPQDQLARIAGDRTQPFSCLRRVLTALRRENYRVICILEEFDTIRNIFRNETHRFNQLRELASYPAYSMGMVFVSKRPLQTLGHAAGQPNNYWTNTLHEVPIRGIDGVLDTMLARADGGIQLGSEVRTDLESLTRDHPYLTELCLYHLWEISQGGRPCTVDDYRIACRDPLRKYWEQVHDILATSRVSTSALSTETLEGDNPEGSYMHKYLQMSLGPMIDVSTEDRVALQNYGILIRSPAKGPLVSFSSGFEEFADRVIERRAPLWAWWSDCERAVRSCSLQLLRRSYGSSWEDELHKFQSKDVEDARDRHREERGNRETESLLDFFSTRALFRVLTSRWEQVGGKFLPGDADDWKPTFSFLSGIRNLPAHSRDHALTAEERGRAILASSEILRYCRKYLDGGH